MSDAYPDDDMDYGQLAVESGAYDQPTVDSEILFREDVERKKRSLRITDAARKELAAERMAQAEVPDGTDLSDLLAEPDEEALYRIDLLWPRHGNIVFAAAYKAGKTTAVGNLVRSLVDGDRFLGVYKVEPVGGVVAVIDFEMARTKLRHWFRDQGIRNANQVKVWTLRGKVGAFGILDEETRSRWVTKLRTARVKVLIIDCLGPILSAFGLKENENAEVGPVLDALTTLAVAAGVEEVLLVHHMGHGAERSRGASRLRDWPDAEWRLMRQRDEANPLADPDPAAPRFFSAFGRDVDVREGQILYDSATRRLRYAEGSRKQAKANGALVAVLAFIRDKPGANVRAIQDAVVAAGVGQTPVRNAIKALAEHGYSVAVDGPKNAKHHTLTKIGHAKLADLTGAGEPADDDPFPYEVTLCVGCDGLVPEERALIGATRCPRCTGSAVQGELGEAA